MRVAYIAPSTHHFDEVFGEYNRGGGLSDIKIYKNSYNKRGGSLFGVLGRSFKSAIPFIKSLILPEIGNFTKNLMDDISQNISPKQSIKSNLKKSVKNVGKKIIRGGNVLQKNKMNTKKNIKKKVSSAGKKWKKKKQVNKCGFIKNDIFSNEKYL